MTLCRLTYTLTLTAAATILLILHPSYAYASDEEFHSLLEFKKGIKTDPLGKIFSTWNQYLPDPSLPSTCPSYFFGVYCDKSSTSVVAVHLDSMGLTGELKLNTLVLLKSLQNLTLSGNFFTGRLVPAIGDISSLQYLDLSGNQFYGPIPTRINDLWGLNYLNLSRNNFTGGYPIGNSNSGQLKVLDLYGNLLWGDVQGLFSGLKNVEYVDLSGNQFFGSLAMSPENVTSFAYTITFLNLSRNKLEGGFFTENVLELFRNLRVLDVGDNEITGQLPSFSDLPNLQVLRLGNNVLYGAIPSELLQGVVPLEELDLSGNGFSGSIPTINSSTLTTLNLSSNALSGVLPSSLGSNCLVVDVSRNLLSDDIKVMGNWGSSLETLDLSSNQLSGSIPNVSQFQSLTSLNIRNNSIGGSLPKVLGSYPKLGLIDLSSNQIQGSIPPALFSSTMLIKLNLSENNLMGSIPIEGSHTSELLLLPSYPQLEFLDLSKNNLSGNISSGIENFASLKVLNLARNGLSGQLPNEMNKLNGLEYLDLSKNNFTGKIPERLSSSLRVFNVSDNNLQGIVPENLWSFPDASFYPGNSLLVLPNRGPHNHYVPNEIHNNEKHHRSKSTAKIAIIVACVGAFFMIAFVLLAYNRARIRDFHVRNGLSNQTAGSRDIRPGIFSRPSKEPPQSSLSFSHDHLLSSNPRSLSGPVTPGTETPEHYVSPRGVATTSSTPPATTIDQNTLPTTSGRRSSPGSPIALEQQPVTLDVYSPDRLAGELFLLDSSLAFTAEELSRAPAEVLGRSSHGTLYKATLDNGHMLTVKWLRVGLVKQKKEFAKEVRKIGSVKHPNFISLRAYYWGSREQDRLILADYIHGDSLALHLYESTPRRYSPLSFVQRLRVAVDVARCVSYLHDKGMTHGNLKPTNILLEGPEYTVRITDYALHRLMTQAGIAEQILNLGALGYRAPELATATKPMPTFKTDVYAFGVILMELLTRRSAGDIISGQSGAVDLTDWVRVCDEEGRGLDCVDRDIAGSEEHVKAMDELLTTSLRCILPVNERPNIRQIYEDLCSISV